ncbi:MAG: hypothetical protein ACHQRJ_20735 [Alphaproteobacteria bacterium]
MIDFVLGAFVITFDKLRDNAGWVVVKAASSEPAAQLTAKQADAVISVIQASQRACNALSLSRADERFSRLWILLGAPYSLTDLALELRTLIEAIEDDIKYECFYHYPQEKGQLLARVPGDWARA